MAYSKADIAAELKNRGIDPTGGFVGQIRHPLDYLGGLTKDVAMAPVRAAQVGIGAGQELQNLGLNIPGVKAGLAKIASLATQPFGGHGVTAAQVQPVQAISPESQQAQVGKLIGQAMAYGYPIGEAGMIGKGIVRGGESLLAKALPSIFRSGAALGTGAAYSPPGQRGIGALETVAMEALPELGIAGLKAGEKPLLGIKGQLAKLIERAHGGQTDASNELYNTAFKGTEGIKPALSPETSENIEELRKNFPGARNDVARALDRYFGRVNKKTGEVIMKPNESLERLHYLKSDLGNEVNDFDLKKIRDGRLDTDDKELSGLLKETRGNISKDLEGNFSYYTSPRKYKQYKIAQNNYANNVAPFKHKSMGSIKQLLSENRLVSPKLYTDLSQDSVPAEKLRNILGVSKPGMEFARMLHSKLVKYPLYGAGITGALYGAKKYL